MRCRKFGAQSGREWAKRDRSLRAIAVRQSTCEHSKSPFMLTRHEASPVTAERHLLGHTLILTNKVMAKAGVNGSFLTA